GVWCSGCWLRFRRARRGRPTEQRSGGDPGLVPAAVPGDESVGRRWTPRSRGVRLEGRWCVKQGLRDPPGFLDAVLAGEVCAVSDHPRMEKDLVGRGRLASLHGEIHM